jgi:hypothetical protein
MNDTPDMQAVHVPPAEELAAGADRLRERIGCTFGRTATRGKYPSVAGVVFLVETGNYVSEETEGAAGTFIPDGRSLYAVHLGTRVPPIGTVVTCRKTGGAWCFQY